MRNLIIGIGLLALVGCGVHTPVGHDSNFNINDKLVLIKDCPVFSHKVNILPANSIIFFKTYTSSEYVRECNVYGGLSVSDVNDGEFCINESCVKLASQPKPKPTVTEFKLKLTCKENGKLVEKLVDSVSFRAEGFVDCHVVQAQIKYETVVEVLSE